MNNVFQPWQPAEFWKLNPVHFARAEKHNFGEMILKWLDDTIFKRLWIHSTLSFTFDQENSFLKKKRLYDETFLFNHIIILVGFSFGDVAEIG